MAAHVSTPPRGTTAGRVIAIIAAVLLLVIGAFLALGGIVLMAVAGPDGKINSASHPVATPTAAIVTDVASIRDASQVADALGTPTATMTASGGNGSGVFVGIGPAAAVDRYLAGVVVDQAVNFDVDPYQLTLTRRPGLRSTAPPPTTQDFWVAQGTGSTTVTATWQVQDGDYRAVLMNADGSPGVNAQFSVGVGFGALFGWALGLLIAGAVLIAAAIALLVLTRPRGYPAAAAPAGPAPPPQQAPAPPGQQAPAGPSPDQPYPQQVPAGQPPAQRTSGEQPAQQPPAPQPQQTPPQQQQPAQEPPAPRTPADEPPAQQPQTGQPPQQRQ